LTNVFVGLVLYPQHNVEVFRFSKNSDRWNLPNNARNAVAACNVFTGELIYTVELTIAGEVKVHKHDNITQ